LVGYLSLLTFAYLCAAIKKAGQWAEYDPKMQKEMMEATEELKRCVQSISDEIKAISTNPISKEAKRNLLKSAKLMMQRTVRAVLLNALAPI